ncbi:MAG: hypothetical protein M3P41_14510 [Actinomycetota bacterium]|jgi:hypothetical protein|nr:hypothetical protein [Actinomycetota bacterium]
MSGMPKQPDAYYHYLQAHHQTDHPVKTWQVDWTSLAWLWGFVLVLAVVIILWLRQYRSTRQRVYPADSWGGYASELAGPATFFFLLFSGVVVAFAVALVVGHLVWGQKF